MEETEAKKMLLDEAKEAGAKQHADAVVIGQKGERLRKSGADAFLAVLALVALALRMENMSRIWTWMEYTIGIIGGSVFLFWGLLVFFSYGSDAAKTFAQGPDIEGLRNSLQNGEDLIDNLSSTYQLCQQKNREPLKKLARSLTRCEGSFIVFLISLVTLLAGPGGAPSACPGPQGMRVSPA